jgi:hypothetical protein
MRITEKKAPPLIPSDIFETSFSRPENRMGISIMRNPFLKKGYIISIKIPFSPVLMSEKSIWRNAEAR